MFSLRNIPVKVHFRIDFQSLSKEGPRIDSV